MFKELFTESNDQKQLFKDIEDTLVISGFQPPKGLWKKMNYQEKKIGANSIQFSFVHSADKEDKLKQKFRTNIAKSFGSKRPAKIKVQDNATKPNWTFEVFLEKN